MPRRNASLLAKILLPLLILGAAIGATIYMVETRPAGKPKAITERTWLVDVRPVTLQTLGPDVTLYGRAESPRAAKLSAAVTADVLEVAVREGQAVAAGELLLRLDAREVELSLRQREADIAEIDALLESEKRKHANNKAALPHEQALLEFAQKAVARAQRLEQRQVASESALDEAHQTVERQKLVLDSRKFAIANHPAQLAQLRARRARAVALRDLAQLDVERCEVRAPFAGIVSQVAAAPGDRVRSGAQLVSLYAQNELEVRAQIPERYLGTIRAFIDADTSLYADAALHDTSVRLRLARLAGESNARSGGIDALFHIEQGWQSLHRNQFVTLNLHLPARENVIALPYSAVYGADQVYILDPEQRMRGVTVERLGETRGADRERLLLVRSDALHAGDQLIISQLPNAMDGLKVQPKSAE